MGAQLKGIHGAVELTGGVDTKVQGPVEAEIPKPIKHEKIRLGIFGL